MRYKIKKCYACKKKILRTKIGDTILHKYLYPVKGLPRNWGVTVHNECVSKVEVLVEPISQGVGKNGVIANYPSPAEAV